MVFHVQTEDSGLLNPHLFTHLFHEGVIVSTRKLVYDAGSNEDAIKSLMQAQHKAVMKDLRKGTFDDKIDQYLAGTPGLEPRAGGDLAELPRGTRAPTEQSPPPEAVIADALAGAGASISGGSPLEIINEDLSEPIELPLKTRDDLSAPIELPLKYRPAAAPAPEPEPAPAQARTKTAERTSRSVVRQPPLPEDDAPTLMGSAASDVGAAVQAANAGARPGLPRAATPPPLPQRSPNPRDSNPVIEISVDEDDIGGRLRGPRDTAVSSVPDELADGVPTRGAESVPQTVPVRPQQRPASHGAAALPAMKPPTRPSVQPPVVTARSSSSGDDQSAAPPGGEPPAERPGQYSVSRKDAAAPMREKTGRIASLNPNPVPAGQSRPGVPATPAAKPDSASMRAAAPNRDATPAPVHGRAQTPPPVAPRPPTPQVQPPASNRIPQPQPGRVHVTAPISNRTPSPAPPAAGSGVVMTRPAVIVGAPPKTAAAPSPPRVRKAREDEGRGFGQGLISEKSLDEVILAYLSEDAEDK